MNRREIVRDYYISRGLQVFPYRNGTTPPKGWPDYRNNDGTLDAIAASSYPIGCVTGRCSGVVVIDIDPQNGGSVAGLVDRYGDAILKTFTVSTPSGGTHLYFNYPENVEYLPKRISGQGIPGLDGVDLLADGHHVVIPPTVRGHRPGKPGGQYRITEGGPAADLPPAVLIDWGNSLQRGSPAVVGTEVDAAPVSEHDNMLRLHRKMVHKAATAPRGSRDNTVTSGLMTSCKAMLALPDTVLNTDRVFADYQLEYAKHNNGELINDLEGKIQRTVSKLKGEGVKWVVPDNAGGHDDRAVPGLEDLDTEWWQSHPVLTDIYDYSLKILKSPWSILADCLALTAVQISPHVTLPDMFGGSLNFFVLQCGPPESGKDAAEREARKIISGSDTFPGHPVGSGEGIQDAFFFWDQDEQGKPVRLRRNKVLMSCSELGKAARLGQRQGSTLWDVLREAYSGQLLGFGNRSKKDATPFVEAGTYRLAMIMCTQSAAANPVVGAEAVGTGTTRRFFAVPSMDARRTMDRFDAHAKPPQIVLPRENGWPVTEIQLPDIAYREMAASQCHDNVGDGRPSGELRARLATLLAVMLEPERFTGLNLALTAQDWERAEVPMLVSLATLDWLTHGHEKVREEEYDRKAERVEGSRERRAVRKMELDELVLDTIKKWSGDPSRRNLKQRLGSKVSGPELVAALARLTAAGVIRTIPPGSPVDKYGTRYEIVS